MSFIHEKAICETPHIGEGTRVWAFSHILRDAKLGSDCNVCEHVFVENDVVIGDRVTLKCGVYLWDGIRIENDVFIGPNATFTNDKYPRSRQMRTIMPPIYVEQGASIGANATILPGIRIGKYSMIGAGAVVTHDVPPYAVVMGNPAVITNYTSDTGEINDQEKIEKAKTQSGQVEGVLLHSFDSFEDLRGSLTVGHFSDQIPFKPVRYFVVYQVPTSKVRGQHAHKVCQQFLVCVNGSVQVNVDNGKVNQTYHLDAPNKGLYIPPRVWANQHDFTHNAVLLVFASHPYEKDDYIRDYREFLKIIS